jgi:DNA-directed RNA polymerase specialized sigma24 family protein
VKRDPFDDLDALVQRVYSYLTYMLRDVTEAERVTKSTFDLALRHRDAVANRGDAVVFVIELARHQLELRGVLQGPKNKDRELLALRICADLTLEQICEVLGHPLDEVSKALDGALARRREQPFALD